MNLVDRPDGTYDVVVAGSGFSSAFFLHRFLAHADAKARVLVLERGGFMAHEDQLRAAANSRLPHHTTWRARGRSDKDWNFTIGFGGSSNCWWGNTPRPHPSDFNLKTRYGLGRDWPLSYDDIEPYLCDVEDIMEISGPDGDLPWPKSRPYKLPPHRINESDRLLMSAYPGRHIPIPTARPSRPARSRPQCCANGVCNLCPIDSKFTILNSFMSPFEDPRVSVLLESEVRAVEHAGNSASGVHYRRLGRDARASGDLVVLAAHGIFNPVILMRSGLTHPLLGRNLHEQLSMRGEVFLKGVEHFQGSTVITGLNYVLYDGPFRSTQSSILIEVWNMGLLRSEQGRWREVVPITIKIEDYPQTRNRVELDPDDPDQPLVIFEEYSPEALGTRARLHDLIATVFAPLPVEKINIDPEPFSTSSHIHGTTVMGSAPEDSIVDGFQIHHRLRNLVVLGSGNFPSGSQTNPTLTICALALRTADKLGRSA